MDDELANMKEAVRAARSLGFLACDNVDLYAYGPPKACLTHNGLEFYTPHEAIEVLLCRNGNGCEHSRSPGAIAWVSAVNLAHERLFAAKKYPEYAQRNGYTVAEAEASLAALLVVGVKK